MQTSVSECYPSFNMENFFFPTYAELLYFVYIPRSVIPFGLPICWTLFFFWASHHPSGGIYLTKYYTADGGINLTNKKGIASIVCSYCEIISAPVCSLLTCKGIIFGHEAASQKIENFLTQGTR